MLTKYLNEFWEGSVEETINVILSKYELILNNDIKALDELIKQSQSIGVKFCEKCGFAKKGDRCYMCNKF